MDVSPAKKSYFTCVNVWWKLLFHSTRFCERYKPCKMVKKRPASYLQGRLFLLFYRATALQRGKSFPSCAWRMPLLHRGFSLALAVGNVKNGHLYFLNINRFCNMCIHSGIYAVPDIILKCIRCHRNDGYLFCIFTVQCPYLSGCF